MNNVDKLFHSINRGGTPMSFNDVVAAVGLTKEQTSSSLYLLTQEGSLKQGPDKKYTRIRMTRPKKRKMVTRLSSKRAIKTVLRTANAKDDALERLLSATAEIERELHELRAFTEMAEGIRK